MFSARAGRRAVVEQREPLPSRTGAMWIVSSSSSPAARACWTALPPPWIWTSLSPAASRAWSIADSIPSVTKWNVVPPSISSGSRAWWVRTKTGW